MRRKSREMRGWTFLFYSCLLTLSCEISGVRCTSCTLTLNGEELTPNDIQEIVLKVNDTLKKGDIIQEYGKVDFTDIEFNDTQDYVKIKTDSSDRVWIEVTRDFQDYEETRTSNVITRTCQLVCTNTSQRQNMRVHLHLTDTNNHVAAFGEESYHYKLPMPFPPGIDISSIYKTIWAYDADFKSEITFNLTGSDLLKVESIKIDDQPLPSASYVKPFYNVKLNATTLIDTTEPINFEITAEDINYPGIDITKVMVTIERDSELSQPKSPVFEQPLYSVQLKEEIHAGDKLETMPRPVRLEDSSAPHEIEIRDGDEGFSSHFRWDSDVYALMVAREFAETEIPESRFGSLTLKATVKNAVRPGYTVVNIVFPEKEEPTTTMETTTLCPTTPEPPTTEYVSTEDPCSKCPTPEPVTFTAATCPATEEPPTCPPCPTLPDDPETTSSDVGSTTTEGTTSTTHPHPTTTLSSTLWTHETDPGTVTDDVVRSTTECYCPTPEEVTCPEAPTCPPCPTFPGTASGGEEETSTRGSTAESNKTSGASQDGTDGTDGTDKTDGTDETDGTDGTDGTEPTVTDQEGTTKPGGSDSTVTDDHDGSHGTPPPTDDGHKTSTECYCPTMDCPEMTTTPLPDPPANAHVKFQLPEYNLWAKSGFFGVISRVVAEPYPSDLERWGEIMYEIIGSEAPLNISNGDLYCTEELEANDYTFTVFAAIPDITDVAGVTVNLKVSAWDVCQNGTEIVTIFHKPFISVTVEEGKTYPLLTDPLDLPSAIECDFSLDVTPEELARNFYVSEFGAVSLLPVDREDAVFQKAEIPEINVIVNAKCTIRDVPSANGATGEDDPAVEHASSMAIQIRVEDINDHPPVFTKKNYVLGYPEKSIAELEHPPMLGKSVATDADVGWNAKFRYMVLGFDVVMSQSGEFYPHPQTFDYCDFNFTIRADDVVHSSTQNVMVKILSSEYLTEIHALGRRLDEAQDVANSLSKSSGFDVGTVSAPFMVFNEEMNDQNTRGRERATEDHESSMIEEDVEGRRNATSVQIETRDRDSSYYLRLVVYAFNGTEPVMADNFKRMVGNVSSEFRVVEYSSIDAACASGAGDMTAAVTALAVILALLVAAIAGFVIYRFRKNRRQGDNDSMESGLVQENDYRKEKHPMYDPDRSSIVYENKMNSGNEQQENGDGEASPERRKSVAFAEEPQVIPSEDDEGDIKM